MLFLQYPPCSTCQKAKKWLDDHGIEYTARHIKEDNPTADELREWVARSGLPRHEYAWYGTGFSREQLLKNLKDLPLSAPIVVVMALYYGVGHWNAYFNAFIYLSDRTKLPLQVFLKEILMQSKFAENEMLQGGDFTPEQLLAMTRMTETANMLKYGIIVISTVPMLCIYPFLQRYFACIIRKIICGLHFRRLDSWIPPPPVIEERLRLTA